MKVILFSNDGCGSCRLWKPTFIKLMDKHGLEYEVIDSFKDKDMARKYDIKGLPCTVFLNNDGNELGHILGNMIEELADRDIEYYKEKDGLQQAQG